MSLTYKTFEYLTPNEKASLFPKVKELFAESFGDSLSYEYWHWRFLDNPIDAPKISMFFDGDRLVSYYAVSPIKLWVKGRNNRAALSNMTMTAPEYQGKGLFPQLATRLFDSLKRNGYEFVIGFPNENSHYSFITKLKWIDIDRIPMLHKENGSHTHAKSDSGEIPKSHIIDFTLNLDLLTIDPIKRDQVARDVDYLKWRFFSHPLHKYEGYFFPDSKDFYLYKEYNNEGNINIDIVEYECTEFDTFRSFISLTAGRCNGWNIWVNPKSALELYLFLEKSGFRMMEPVIYLSYLSLSSKRLDDSFSYKMSDSDIF
ncbi:MAG TPA: GNAT family N-acetyltransferase [Thermotogota bacterium]|nr:GNAT family N-acetyltransferase [Thermotogota bacterium]